jgi:outer membrane protein OmpA-like peptidoglycan-associated protein
MKHHLLTAIIIGGTILTAGCATKNYVKKTVDPVNGKVDQQGQAIAQTNQNLDQTKQTLDQTKQNLDQTRATLEKDETDINGANERAVSAGNRADEANNKATQIGRDLGDLKNTVANLDDYKQVAETTVNFKFNSDKLTPDAKQELDQMVANQQNHKRYFVAVEGFTDQTGSDDYNTALSRRRADTVVEYLVAEHNIPIYRIHMVGLGKQKPVEEARTRAAQAKNRRVEVALFSADKDMAMATQPETAAAQAAPSQATPQQ